MGLLLVAYLAPVAANAQDGDAKFGLKGGLNLSNFYNASENVTDQNLQLGYHAGLFAKVPLVAGLSLQPEALLTTTGTKRDYEFGGGGLLTPGASTIRLNLTYLQVPLLAVVNLGENVNLHAGPYVAYLLGANVSNDSENDSYDTVDEIDRGDFNDLDFGVAAGIGFELDPLVIGLRYNYGLRDVGNGSGIAGELTEDSRNSSFQLSLGFGF